MSNSSIFNSALKNTSLGHWFWRECSE